MAISDEFNHPTAGKAEREKAKLAIFWHQGITAKDRDAVLKEHKLTLARLEGQQPNFQVNQTDALTWAESDRAISAAALRRIEAEKAVDWVSGVYRSAAGKDRQDPTTLFCVNPTRLYLARDAAERLGGVDALDLPVTVNAGRSARLKGMIALDVGDVKAADGASAIEMAEALRGAFEKRKATLSPRDIRFENIPFISPICAAPPYRLEYRPNDPRFEIEWGMRRINATHAWNITRGDPDVVVAVIDEGVQLDHPDLHLHPQSWNATTDLPDGSPTGNHGTACAGIVAGTIDNAQGVAGVAGRSRIMAIATATWADVDIAEGLYFAADNGAHVVSMSFGVYPSWGIWDFDLIRDALQYALERDLVLIAASGNENGNESRFPGSDSRTICVGGTNREDLRKEIGDTSIEPFWGASFGPDLDVVAPCLEIPTTDRLAGFGYDPTDYYDRFNGTSSATPHVAGLAALILSVRPDLSNESVREIIETTCDKIRPGTYTYALTAAKPNDTWNEEVGYGLVNAERAVKVACEFGRKDKGDCRAPCVHVPEPDPCCVGPKSPPWKDVDSCFFWYENRFIGDARQGCQVRIVYEHCLRLEGRQQGPLLYSTTLLPGETVRLYTYDRYRRVKSETQRLSISASLRQTVSAQWESSSTQRENRYQEFLTTVRSDDDSDFSVGGMLFPVSWDVDDPDPATAELLVGHRTETVSSRFARVMASSTQQVEAERSIVVSTYEENDSIDTTARSLHNANDCHAVTYYVRRVFECYSLVTRVVEVSWRGRKHGQEKLPVWGPWRPIDDLSGIDANCKKFLDQIHDSLPRVGDAVSAPRAFAVPTDGTVINAELAHCSSCDPMREAELKIALEHAHSAARRAGYEADLLELEVKRRRELLNGGRLEAFALPMLAREIEVEDAD